MKLALLLPLLALTAARDINREKKRGNSSLWECGSSSWLRGDLPLQRFPQPGRFVRGLLRSEGSREEAEQQLRGTFLPPCTSTRTCLPCSSAILQRPRPSGGCPPCTQA